MEKISEILGWYGVAAIFVAYALLSFNIIESSSLIYQALNLTGSLGIIYDAFRDKNYQPVVLNILWAVIAAFALVKIIL